jgi:uncharacterized protein YdhG (YjbR/CyaY superfamily)
MCAGSNPAGGTEGGRVSSWEIDSYLEGVPAEQRVLLSELRATILACVPEADEVISYRIPAFRVDGAVVAGFASFTNHMSYLPFSGSVLAALSDEITGHPHTKSSLHFTLENPLSDSLVERLLAVRRAEILARGR